MGGDWFDVIRLSGSRVGLVVGDVVGHGMHAAATMGRLRTAVRTLADVDLEPEELLTRLDDVVTRLADEDELATDGSGLRPQRDLPVRGLRPGVPRAARWPGPGTRCPPSWSPTARPSSSTCPPGRRSAWAGCRSRRPRSELPEGSLLVLYTDGLIESRQRDIDTGLNAMRKVLGDVHAV